MQFLPNCELELFHFLLRFSSPFSVCRFRPATDAVSVPQSEPRAVRQPLIVRSIRSRDIALVQWPGIRHSEQAFQPLDLVNDPLNIHSSNSIANKLAAIILVEGTGTVEAIMKR